MKEQELEFFSNHNHTEFSNIRNSDCIIKVEDLIDSAYKKGYKGISITDHECVSSFVKANRHYYNNYSNTDFKVALGNEIYLVKDVEELKANGGKHYHFILVAKNLEGNKQIRQLSSTAWSNYFVKNVERVPITYNQVVEIIGNNKGNIIATTSCLGGFLATKTRQLLNEQDEIKIKLIKKEINTFIKWCINTFGKENFYLEIQPSQDLEQIEYNKYIVNTISKAYGLKYILATDSHYINKEEQNIHSAFINADKEDTDRERDSFYKYSYMQSIEQMRENTINCLSDEEFKIAINNTINIYDSIEMYNLKKEVTIPQVDIEEKDFTIKHILKDYYNTYNYIEKFAFSEHIQDRFFFSLLEQGIINKNIKITSKELERINYELEHFWEISDILKQRISSYLNITKEFIDFIWEYSYVGAGRGSIGGNYCAFLMDIIQYSPLGKDGEELDLKAWRFIHKDMPSLPDVDIDISPDKRPLIFEKFKEKYGQDNIMQIATYTKEGSKSAIKTVARGMGIDSDISSEMAGLIKTERGMVWSIKDCLYGNIEKGRKPITEFKNLIDKYEGLEDAVLKIEGLITARGTHAAGMFLFKNGYIDAGNSLMKTKGGIVTTCYDLYDSEEIGNMKFDLLVTDVCSKLMTAMELLEKDGKIENQGSLRETYNKYLHPYYAIDYNNEKLYELLYDNSVLDIFQFSTTLSVSALKSVKPKTLMQVAQLNSLMRLAVDEGEQPIDRFIRYSNNINEWYNDMREYGLTENEISVLEEHLLHLQGVCESQESLMMLSQDTRIAGFSVGLSNKLRKIISKKKINELDNMYKIYIENGTKLGARKLFLNYVWWEQFKMSFGYSFNLAHTFFYSLIAMQQLHLCLNYGSIYWNTAVLICNAGAMDLERDVNVDYGRVAKGLGDVKKQGIDITLPDINKSDFRFAPDYNNNRILYGLFAISKVNKEISREIIENRPYSSLEDFIKKVKLPNEVMLNLIKSGSFNLLEGEDRKAILEKYFYLTTDTVKTIGNTQLIKLIDNDCLEEFDKFKLRLVKYRKYIQNPRFEIKIECMPKSKKYYKLDNKASDFFVSYIQDLLQNKKYYIKNNPEHNKVYTYDENGDIIISKKDYDDFYKDYCKDILAYCKTDEALQKYKELLVKEKVNEVFTSIPEIEMESLNYYYTEHILDKCNLREYGVEKNFDDLPREPLVEEIKKSKNGREFLKFKTTRLAGTVIHKENSKHLVYILCPDNTVVAVKFRNGGKYNFYNKQISSVMTDGKKKILDKSWFGRHNNIIVTGFRQADQFICQTYNNDEHSVAKITGIKEDGFLWLETERVSNY